MWVCECQFEHELEHEPGILDWKLITEGNTVLQSKVQLQFE